MVSIVIPVYNVQDFLRECLDSILNQDYRDLEIIIVDDGSTDESGMICDEYAKKDTRIKVVHQVNKGLSAARNTALDIATGEYLMFVDSDDYVAGNYVSYLVSVMEQEKDADMAICRFYNNYEQQDGTYLPTECITQPEKYIMNGEEILTKRFGPKKVYYVLAWNKIYRRSLFENLRYPEGHNCEDAWVSLDLYQACKKVVCTKESLYFYRNRKGSVSSTISPKWVMSQLQWLEREINFFLISKNPGDVSYPAIAFVSLMYKQRKLIDIKENPMLFELWNKSINILLHDEQISAKNKAKYIFYRVTYRLFR